MVGRCIQNDSRRLQDALVPFYVREALLYAEALTATTTAEPKLIADELAKLWELHKAGALTEEEFSAHKARLLS